MCVCFWSVVILFFIHDRAALLQEVDLMDPEETGDKPLTMKTVRQPFFLFVAKTLGSTNMGIHTVRIFLFIRPLPAHNRCA